MNHKGITKMKIRKNFRRNWKKRKKKRKKTTLPSYLSMSILEQATNKELSSMKVIQLKNLLKGSVDNMTSMKPLKKNLNNF